jgi:hypothetical protein
MLEQVTRQVQPVMRKHGWRVPLVTEFFPQNPALLVRERPAPRRSTARAGRPRAHRAAGARRAST